MVFDVTLPQLAETISEGEVLAVRVGTGDIVVQDQTLLEVEAEKSTVEVPSPFDGRVIEVLVKSGEVVKFGQRLFRIDGADGAKVPPSAAPKAEVEVAVEAPAPRPIPAAPEAKEPEPQRPAPSIPTGRLVPAGPMTRRLARELGIDLSLVEGSGRGGRVTEEDLKRFVRQQQASPAVRPSPSSDAQPLPLPLPLPDFTRWGPVESRPWAGIRRRTGTRLSLSWARIPQVTHYDEADVTDLERFRHEFAAQIPKVTITAFALGAAAMALRRYPEVNASLDTEAARLIIKRYVHLGVAVDTKGGLVVPVVRDADRKTVSQLAREVAVLADKARAGDLPPEAMQGATFTITNLGGIGGTAFSPLVNFPEVAILGLSRVARRPALRNGQLVERAILPLALSYDHRVIDGAAAARFVRHVAGLLEQPLLMLMGGGESGDGETKNE